MNKLQKRIIELETCLLDFLVGRKWNREINEMLHAVNGGGRSNFGKWYELGVSDHVICMKKQGTNNKDDMLRHFDNDPHRYYVRLQSRLDALELSIVTFFVGDEIIKPKNYKKLDAKAQALFTLLNTGDWYELNIASNGKIVRGKSEAEKRIEKVMEKHLEAR